MFNTSKRLLRAMCRLEDAQQEILAKLERLETLNGAPGETQRSGFAGERTSGGNEGYGTREDEWVQSGIDNILSYQAGKKQKEGEGT